MKLKFNKTTKKWTISELASIETDVIMTIIDNVNRRCFCMQEDSGDWYSNDDFILSLTNEERQALAKIGKEITDL